MDAGATGTDLAGPCPSESWGRQRLRLRTYFDRTAVAAWETLTTDAPVSGVRAKVRAGRDATRACLLGWLPEDMRGLRLLDAGSGTGALAAEAGARGAEVLGIDLSPTLVEVARRRLPAGLADRVAFAAGDMLDVEAAARAAGLAPDADGRTRFDAIVAMDSLIHYEAADMVGALATLGGHLKGPGAEPGREPRLVFTFAPATPLLVAAKAAGKLFPKRDRSPAIAPVAEARLRAAIGAEERLGGLGVGRTRRISVPFYVSQPMELVRDDAPRHDAPRGPVR